MRDGNPKKSKVCLCLGRRKKEKCSAYQCCFLQDFFFFFLIFLVFFFLMKFSWPKTLVKKWLNIKSKTEEFHADDVINGGGGGSQFHLQLVKF